MPTDCPQRDERLGWAGDAQVFIRTATFNRDVQSFFRKWLKRPGGRPAARRAGYRHNTHDRGPCRIGGHTGWADVATIVPWQHYMAYGDRRILENQYPSNEGMGRFHGRSVQRAPTSGTRDGTMATGSSTVSSTTIRRACRPSPTSPLIQQCFFANSAELTSKAAAVLGHEEEAAYYADVAAKAKAREAFCNAYLTPAGYLVSATQTAYVLALYFDMVPESMRPVVASRLADKVREYGHITTGIPRHALHLPRTVGVGLHRPCLHASAAPAVPGGLYPVTMGATTIWERWNSMMPDRTIPNNGMNSFNHYSYGAIGDWLYREAVGLHETSPGFKTMAVKPHTGGGFTQMRAEQLTPYGRASAEWRDEEGFSRSR